MSDLHCMGAISQEGGGNIYPRINIDRAADISEASKGRVPKHLVVRPIGQFRLEMFELNLVKEKRLDQHRLHF